MTGRSRKISQRLVIADDNVVLKVLAPAPRVEKSLSILEQLTALRCQKADLDRAIAIFERLQAARGDKEKNPMHKAMAGVRNKAGKRTH
jgi:hypothetical protein